MKLRLKYFTRYWWMNSVLCRLFDVWFVVTVVQDDETKLFTAVSEDIPGLVVEAVDLNELRSLAVALAEELVPDFYPGVLECGPKHGLTDDYRLAVA
jgi:hypothetical protein